ncbi:MAG: ribosome biogenesis GTPase Der [Candidatus Sumerlaeaceae bacterium]|nr:ribosome biogenesis GTPase Der [Candidatus Sumerlaeaceae bacterium]
MTSGTGRRGLPIVAIVGRPNVGKSTLFNRVIGQRKAAVHDTPGLTRDRNYHPASWAGRDFLLVDTGGYEIETGETIYRLMREQTLMAIEEADVIVFMTDANELMNPTDDDLMDMLRQSHKPVLVAANKSDNETLRMAALSEFARFGAPEVFPISAAHGVGTGDLLDEVAARLPVSRAGAEADTDAGIRIAVVGRQNVGKSTLVNRILGYERVIACDVPGTTRDAVDTTFERDGQRYTLIDTAGIRRRGKVEAGAERLSVTSSVMSMERCDIALVVVDAARGLADQDAHVAGYAVDAGCACVLVVNKWDLVEKDSRTADDFKRRLRQELAFMSFAPVLFVSALTGLRVQKLFEVIRSVDEQYRREIATPELNEFLKRATAHVSPPVQRGRQLKIKYVTQTGSRPPTFTFFVNDPKLVHFSYERYLANQLRREYGFEGTPLRLRFRKKSE